MLSLIFEIRVAVRTLRGARFLRLLDRPAVQPSHGHEPRWQPEPWPSSEGTQGAPLRRSPLPSDRSIQRSDHRDFVGPLGNLRMRAWLPRGWNNRDSLGGRCAKSGGRSQGDHGAKVARQQGCGLLRGQQRCSSPGPLIRLRLLVWRVHVPSRPRISLRSFNIQSAPASSSVRP
jgi:hypothetical protein